MDEKLTGLVLKSVPVTDTKNLLTVLTPDRGRKTISCHGAKKLTGRNMPAVQPFCYSDFICAQKNGFLTLKESFLKESFFELRCDLYSYGLGCYFLELAGECATEEEPAEELLSLTLNSLYALCTKKYQPVIVKACHELRLLAIEGSGPLYDSCAVCGRPISGSCHFCPAEGGTVCTSCRKEEPGKCYPLDEAARSALKYLMICPLKQLFSFRLSEKSLQQLSLIAEQSVLHTFERSFESLKFYKKLEEEIGSI